MTNAAVAVSNGLFAVTLDFGAGVFTGPVRWLEIGVRTNGSAVPHTTLAPRQPLTASPYAIHADSAGTVNSVSWNSINGVPVNIMSNMLGSVGNQPLELKVNGQRALRLEPTRSNDTVNVLAGSSVNSIASNVISATIAGGGTPQFNGGPQANRVGSDFGTIGGGAGNRIGTNSNSGVIGGGFGHTISDNSFDGTISGGSYNWIGTNSWWTTISGGQGNWIQDAAGASTIGGGLANSVGANSGYATVGGGYNNRIQPISYSSTIAGGFQNLIEPEAFNSTIGGGYTNVVGSSAPASTIAGGTFNRIASLTVVATISGGTANYNGGSYSTIGGGVANASFGDSAVIAGGYYNRAENNSATVGGGGLNLASGFNTTIAGGAYNTNLSPYSTIAGGQANLIEPGADLSTIGGGWLNYIQNTADQSVIAGGNAGRIEGGSRESFVGGGFANTIRSNSAASFIGGGVLNTNGPGAPFSTVAGGERNLAGSRHSFVGGGLVNSISNSASVATIGGGQGNHISTGQAYSTIAGGLNNLSANRSDRGFIGGGSYNTLGQFTFHGTIGGGMGNATFFNAQFPALLGGLSNLVANGGSVIPGGMFNTNAGFIGVISGGESNFIGSLADHSVIGGGGANRVSGSQLLDVYGTIGGGRGNTTQTNTSYPTIGGGLGNTVRTNAHYAVIPGGMSNEVAGTHGFAAGHRASALHPGAFVWADATPANFASTASNQFNVRATGGVRLETGGAGMILDGVNVLSGIVPNAGLAGTYSSALTLNNANNAFTGAFSGNGGGVSNVNATTLGGVGSNGFWKTVGNAGTSPAANFIGTTDNQPLNVKVGGVTAWRIDPTAYTPNIIGGLGGFIPTLIAPNVRGAVVAGGAAPAGPVTGLGGGDFHAVYDSDGVIGGGFGNKVGTDNANVDDAPFATVAGGVFNGAANYAATVAGGAGNLADGVRAMVGGGAGNRAVGDNAFIGAGVNNRAFLRNSTVAGGENNIATNAHAAVAGGGWNTASGVSSFIGGGGGDTFGGPWPNTASGDWSAILGGWNNTASGYSAVVGGGGNNTASGVYAVVPGGDANRATANNTFAAGRSAQALHAGSFVWADSSGGAFSSSDVNQFNVRAAGGVRIFGAGLLSIGATNGVQGNTANPGASGVYGENSTNGYGVMGRAAGNGYGVLGENLSVDSLGYGVAGRSTHIGVFGESTGGGWAGYFMGDVAVTGQLTAVGSVCAQNGVNCLSDRNAKRDFAAVDARAVLENVVQLPMQTWVYTNNPGVRHLGPIAQDFHAAFNLGADEKSIATVDADGVALAAIQGLNQKLEEQLRVKDREITELKEAVAELRRLVLNPAPRENP